MIAEARSIVARASLDRERVANGRVALVSFVLAFAVLLSVALIEGAKPFYYDSLNYWMLGETFVRHGDFSLLNFNSPLRGYLLPLVDHGLQGLAGTIGWSPSTSARIFNALVFALICGVLGPAIAELAWPQRRWGMWRRLALVVPFIVFWRGFLSFPLSDFPALACVLLALVASARPLSPAWMLLAGVAAGAAIQARPSYTTLVVIVPVLVAWRLIEDREPSREWLLRVVLCLTLLIAGFVGISLPQSLQTHRHFKSWSFVPGSADHLENLQLTEGLRLQRYETYIGTGHGPQMFYEDPSGAKLLSSRAGAQVSGIGEYVSLTAEHPLTIAGVIARHVVSGLDQRYSTPYIEHLDTGSHRWMRIVGFLLIFLALLRLLWPASRRALGKARWRYPVALIACCVTSLPSAMETRFLLPLYVLIYLLVLAPGWPSPLVHGASGLRRWRTVAVITAAAVPFLVVFWAVTSATSSHLHFG
ncbi:MAG TPA: hypothetical protein VMB05_03325 [Solirubrobacteraceae bacterium]|nr:hypothetical protein [Solirubrobacteraceae bacterium]